MAKRTTIKTQTTGNPEGARRAYNVAVQGWNRLLYQQLISNLKNLTDDNRQRFIQFLKYKYKMSAGQIFAIRYLMQGGPEQTNPDYQTSYLIYIHKGAGRGYLVQNGNSQYIGKGKPGKKREKKEWLNPALDTYLPQLAALVATKYADIVSQQWAADWADDAYKRLSIK